MKLPKRSSRHQTSGTSAARRSRLLAAFERSGLSATAFARRHGINYTTFCSWRPQRAKAKPSPRFVRVELPTPALPVELTIESGVQARVRVHGAGQIGLAVELIQALNAKTSY